MLNAAKAAGTESDPGPAQAGVAIRDKQHGSRSFRRGKARAPLTGEHRHRGGTLFIIIIIIIITTRRLSGAERPAAAAGGRNK